VLNIDKILDAWKEDPEMQGFMEKLGSDYDEEGIPYWHYHEVNCACTACLP
jgi:hypothetical protein